MSAETVDVALWNAARGLLLRAVPELFELEPGGALAMPIGNEGWLLEITPTGRLVCQVGLAMEDVQTLLSDGTCEDLGTDELAKQARAFIQRSATQHRQALLGAGFEEASQMNADYVAISFSRPVDLQDSASVLEAIRDLRSRFASQ